MLLSDSVFLSVIYMVLISPSEVTPWVSEEARPVATEARSLCSILQGPMLQTMETMLERWENFFFLPF